MKVLLICAALLASPFALCSESHSRLATRLAQGESPKVVIYGTSLSSDGAWTQQLAEELAKRYPGKVQWVNAAKSGVHSDWGLANLQERVLSQNPDIVFLEFAVNDAVARFNLPLHRSKRNLAGMIDRLRAQNPKVEILLQTTNPVIDHPKGNSGYRPHLDRYFQMVRQLAKEKRTLLVDHETNWRRVLDEGRAAYHRWVPDGLHPNEEGYAQVTVDAFLESLGVAQADAAFQKKIVFDLLLYGGALVIVIVAIRRRSIAGRVYAHPAG